jgi:hypothetical protein
MGEGSGLGSTGTCRDAVSDRGRVEQHVVRSQIGRRGHTGRQIRAGCCDSSGTEARIEGMLRRAVTWVDWVVLGVLEWCPPNRARTAVEGRHTELAKPHVGRARNSIELQCAWPCSYSDRVQMQCSGGEGGHWTGAG